jgi:hypothetical protein
MSNPAVLNSSTAMEQAAADRPSKHDVFMSYSRRDKEFVRRLYDALEEHQRHAWVDWEGIPPSADWMREVFAAIESADVFVLVLTEGVARFRGLSARGGTRAPEPEAPRSHLLGRGGCGKGLGRIKPAQLDNLRRRR